MLSGHDPGRKGSVAPPKAKVMIRVVRGMLANLRLISRHPTTGCPQFIGGRMSLNQVAYDLQKCLHHLRVELLPGMAL